MATRILIQVAEKAQGTGQLPEGAMGILQAAGAQHIGASHAELPGLFTAILPEGAPVETLLAQLKCAPDIRHVERDAMRYTL